MKMIHTSVALFALLATSSGGTQSPAATNTLAQALATLASADANKDGHLSSDEVAVFGLSKAEFSGVDADGDGFVARDEFLVFYRQRLQSAGQSPAADLETEVTRIQALRKAKAAEDARLRRAGNGDNTGRVGLSRSRIVAVDQARQPGAVEPATGSIEGRLLAALDALDRRGSAAGASKEDFQRVRDLLIERAREADIAAKGADAEVGAQSEAHRKLMQSLDRIEKKAGEGAWSKDEYQTLRDAVIRRARNIASGADASRPGSPGAPASETLPLEPGLQRALDSLEQHATLGQAVPADYQAVRDQLAARARAQARGASVLEQQAATDTYTKLIQSIDRLEKRTAQGGYSREEFEVLRQSFVKRARNIDAGTNPSIPAQPSTDPANPAIGTRPAPGVVDAGTVEKGLTDALDALEKRAAAGGATREDWQRVRDQLSARARAAVAGLAPAEAESQGETWRKLEQSLNRLEKRANEGLYSKEEFDVLRQSFTHRARSIAGDAQSGSGTQPPISGGGATPVKLDGGKGRAERTSGARDAGSKGSETPAPAPPVSEPKPERPAPTPPPPAPVDRPKPERPPHGGR